MRENQIISVGESHSLVISDQGQVYAFGDNRTGKLGLGNNATYWTTPQVVPGLPSIKSVLAGNNYSAFLTEQGEVYLAGFESTIGLQSKTPIPILGLPPIKLLSGASDYLLMVDVEGRVWGFGARFDRRYKPFLIKNLPPIAALADRAIDWVVDGVGDVWSISTSYTDPPTFPVRKLSGFPPTKDIYSGGSEFDLILDNQDQVWGLGHNKNGQLGLGETTHVNIPTLIPDLPPIRSISTSSRHSLLLDETRQVWTFGNNANEIMGFSNEDYASEQMVGRVSNGEPLPIYAHPILIPGLSEIDSISAGNYHTLVTNVHGEVYSFGLNNHGQLGLGDQMFQLTPMIIPNIRAKVTSYQQTDIITVYPIIQYLSEDIESFAIRSLTDRDSLAEYVSKNGTVYLAQIRYNSSTDQQDPPLENVEETYYLILENLIKNQQLTEFEVTPDLYEDALGNKGFMFRDPDQQIYLIRIYQDENGGIHRPLL